MSGGSERLHCCYSQSAACPPASVLQGCLHAAGGILAGGRSARSAAPASRSWLTNPAVSGSRIRCRQRSADALAEALPWFAHIFAEESIIRLNPFRTFCPNTFVRCGLRVTCRCSRRPAAGRMCPSASPVRRPFDSPRLRRIRGERKRRTCEPFRESVKDRATPRAE